MTNTTQFDLYIFGSNSQLVTTLISKNKAWFKHHVRNLIVCQRGTTFSKVYKEFSPQSFSLDCANPQNFRLELEKIIKKTASSNFPIEVITAYGVFNWNFAPKNPVFSFSDTGFQINLNARLQIIDAFKKFHGNTRFHLFGSLFANFPYAGDYALSMWYVNQLPKNPEYRDLDMIIYNLGGMKTKFWNYKAGGENNPFVFKTIPIDSIFEQGFIDKKRGAVAFYPTLASRIACFLGSLGLRVL